MRKIFNKILLAVGSTCLVSNLAFAQETICYVNEVEKPSTVENLPLEGTSCDGKFSLNQMKNSGWDILDIKITTSQNKFNYSYYLIKNEVGNRKPNDSLTKIPSSNEYNSNKEFSVKTIGTKIENIDNNKSTINIGNLIVGQSGIVVHIYDNDKRLIVSNAKVISSNANSSVVEFLKFNDLKQGAIPMSKREVAKNDVLLLNYMYNSSLLIAPNINSFQAVRDNFKLNNFIHSDLFAARLKVEHNPYPKKEDIQNFAIEQNLGTIFMVIENKVFVIDTKTFTILESYLISYENKDVIKPFYTRIENIEETIFSWSYFDFFSNKKNTSYDDYYKKILGVK